MPVIKFGMRGKTEQVQTTGAQLIPSMKKCVTHYGVTLDISGEIWKIKGTANGSGGKTILCTKPLELDAGIYTVGTRHLINENVYISKKDGTLIGRDKVKLENNEIVVIGINVKAGEIYDDMFTVMLNKGESLLPYEPYTGGKPSPSPEYPQPIEVTDHPVTVTFKGGTEQQSITFVPPRPLTKWDKLEKIDGVWQWVYQSKKYTVTGDESFVTGGNDYFAGTSMCCYIIMENTAYHTVASFMNRLRGKNLIWSMPSEIGYSLNSDQLHIRLPYEILGSKDTDTIEEKKRAYVNFMKQEYDTGNPFEIFYKTNNVEHIPLSQSEQDKLNTLTMYAQTTEITNDGGCQMELTYTVDTKSYVDSKIAEISKAII